MSSLSVSFIIPAHNAADTLAETIASLVAQTISSWEAIIVDDGSVDTTRANASTFAAQDSRIRVVSQPQGGVSVARNHGIRLARYEWLLFLDADDWIAPNFLECMTTALSDNPDWGWACCCWARVTPDGELIYESYSHRPDQLFANLARACTFAIHACVVRKALVESVGGFNPALRTCEEWDLWQRIARIGVPFGVVDDVLAYYRMRPNSTSINGRQMLSDALRVITQGHTADARVPNPLPQYKHGQPVEQLSGAKLQWLTWAAALVIGSGQDATFLLEMVSQETEPGLEPFSVAYNIFEAVMLPTCQSLSAWSKLWVQFYPQVSIFLKQLEIQSTTVGLARRSQLILEHLILDRLVLEQAALETSLTLGLTHAHIIEITKPIAHFYAPQGVDRFYGYIKLNGELLGTVELPICDGWIASEVLIDAIAAKFAWVILGRFFQHTVYPTASVEELETLHNQTGWQVFLQQLWNRPEWSSDRFYDATYPTASSIQRTLDDHWITVEISEELPDLTVNSQEQELTVSVTVGGIPLGGFQVPIVDNQVTAQALRVAITLDGGLELCVAVVREALIGKSIANPMTLSQRLAAVAQQHNAIAPTSLDILSRLSAQNTSRSTALILGRRTGAVGTSICRRAMLPAAATQDLQNGAIALNELVQLPDESPIEWAMYTPEWYTPESLQQYFQYKRSDASITSKDIKTNHQNRNHFETLFATQPDPWKYTSDYEQTKYEQTLSLLPRGKVNNVLELACAEGHFTVQLAPKVKRLLAADISQIALERTAERCKQFKHIDYKRFDLVTDEVPGSFELIICSEVLYYVGDQSDLKKVALKLTNALEPGGYLLMAHAHLVVDEPDRAGFDWMVPFGAKGISDAFSSVPDLRLAKEIWTPLYRVQLFQRLPKFEFPWQRSLPQRIEFTEQPTTLPPKVEARVLWQGGTPQVYEEPPVTTARLPILMYHRVAPNGLEHMKRYRVTPQAFEQQLQYLRDAGYYSVTWEAWREVVMTRCPLPGRAIALTFDDGYQDFFDYAAPLLKQYGFSATVFLVADYVGHTNSWDKTYGELLPLMDWPAIRQLQTGGIEFGSHTCSHAPLTSLNLADIVREAVRSRSILTEKLGVPITSFAYPHGDFDATVEHLIGASGYTVGVSCRSGSCRYQDSLLALPRIEIMGTDDLRTFVAKLR